MKQSRFADVISVAGLLTLLVLPAFVQAQVQRWVDEKGIIHFNDGPMRMRDAASVARCRPSSPRGR